MWGNDRKLKIIGGTTFLLGMCTLAACAGGGGGNLATSIPSGMTPPATIVESSPPPTPTPTSSPVVEGTLLPLPAAGFGPTAVPAQLANVGGPSFTGASGAFPAANTSFPVLASSLVVTGMGEDGPTWTPETSPTSVTATVQSVATDGAMQIQLSVPSLNLNVMLPITVSTQPGGDYAQLANWQVLDAQGSPIRTITGVFGYETPAAAMPVSGTASYSATGTLGGIIFSATGGQIAFLYGGSVALSVNFATGQISGGLTNLVAGEIWPPGDPNADGYSGPWYDVSIAASIQAGTNKFSGITAVGPTSQPLGRNCHCLPVSAFLSNSAKGSINGGFYGPAAQNLGAVWTIGDSNLFALGSFGAVAH